ncbi:MAG: ATP-binding cassette domain-containing protein [Bacilli bacterium]|nr:ATP-binding cassette domain-containing protein [Bacilli bacterium]
MANENNNNKEVVLSARHIDISFGRGKKLFKAVEDVSFDIYKGETVSLVGESGSGKTTIGRAIVRINPLSNGYITFKDELINGKLTGDELLKVTNDINEKINKTNEELPAKLAAAKSEEEKAIIQEEADDFITHCNDALKSIRTGKLTHRQKQKVVRRIQMIFQDPAASLNERATIDYIISEGLYNFHLFKDEKDRVAKVEKIITDVGLLPEHLTRYPHEFSGGQRQRVGIARSIVMEPEFIVADEPISALDVSIRAQVLNLLKKFQKERGLTYLFIAHDLSIVRFISDRILVIHKGKIVEIAETEELFNHPLHPYTKSLMSAIPVPDPRIEKAKKLFVYDPKIHDYSVNKPSLVDIGHGHFVFGNEEEIKKYKKIREAQ